jgi:sugar lactone lactonase YvrE
MVFKKTIIQVYSGNEPFGFHDFVRGTLRLFNYAVDHNIDIKINVQGAEFEPYMIVNNYQYDTINIKPKIYYMETDQTLLVNHLDAFMMTPDPLFVVTSNVWLNRINIYNLSFIGFDSLVRYKDFLYTAAMEKVQANLLYRPVNSASTGSDNLLYGYSIIYLNRDDYKYKISSRNLFSLANQIRRSLDFNKDIMVFSNSIQLRKILSQYIEMNSAAVQTIDDSDIDIGVVESFPTIQDIMIDFILLMKAKKIYRFTNGHVNATPSTDIYETAFDINNILGNLEITTVPLYYRIYTIVGSAKPIPSNLLGPTNIVFDASDNPISEFVSPQPGLKVDPSGNYISSLNNPEGIALDISGNLFIADTANNRICLLDISGNLTTYAGSINGTAGYLDSGASNALFNGPTAIAVDKAGNIYVADTGNNVIRVIQENYLNDASGNPVANHRIVSTLVGQTNRLNSPRGVAVDSNGLVYISDTGNHRICKITAGGQLQTLAGLTTLNGVLGYLSGYINGEGNNAAFNSPNGLTVDLIGNIYVADTGNNVIRRVTQNGKVSTVAGSAQPFFKEGKREKASFKGPKGITVDLDNILYVADTGNNVIRRITTDGDVLPVVGAPDQKPGSIDGYGAIDPTRALVHFNKRATFFLPTAIAVDSSKILYIADTRNNTVRKVTTVFSTPTKIKPISMQSIRVTNSPGVGLTLGPTLSAPPSVPNTIIYGHRKGAK